MAEVAVVNLEPLWVDVKTLCRLYTIEERYCRKLIAEMRAKNKYRINIARSGTRLLRVNLAGFDEFWRKKLVLKSVEGKHEN